MGEIRPWQGTRVYSGHLVQGSLIPLNHSEGIGKNTSEGTGTFPEAKTKIPKAQAFLLRAPLTSAPALQMPATSVALPPHCSQCSVISGLQKITSPRVTSVLAVVWTSWDLTQLCCLCLYTIHLQLGPHPACTEALA